jgi:predicted TIM-barrel enzyme
MPAARPSSAPKGFVFAHVADEGIIESSAGRLLRYRKAIGADAVRVFVDIKKKHSAHAITSDVDWSRPRTRPSSSWPTA